MEKRMNDRAGAVERRVIDLHCDSLTEGAKRGIGLDSSEMPHFSVNRLPAGMRWCQCMAIFVPDELRGDAAVDYFETHCAHYRRETARLADAITPVEDTARVDEALDQTPFATILTVEGGAALAGKPENLPKMYARGVRMMTLTWNAANEIAGGADTDEGFTPLGRRIVGDMERLGMAVDVSHLSDRGFWELCEFATRPFAASHSNSRAVCGHRRNLTDDMFREISRRGGVVGLNYSDNFIRDGGGSQTVDDLLRHLYRFLELGGEDAVALGSDFDGTDIPEYLNGLDKMDYLVDVLERSGLSAAVVDKLLYRNGLRFFGELSRG